MQNIFYSKATLVNKKSKIQHISKLKIPEIAFTGKSNVGKSKLIQCITKYTKLFTSKKPGSTKKICYYNINSEILIVDLPGLGFSINTKQQILLTSKILNQYFKNTTTVSIVVYVLDVRREITNNDLDILDYMKASNRNVLIIYNKIDKVDKYTCIKKTKILENLCLKYINIIGIQIASCLQKVGIINIITLLNKLIKKYKYNN